MSFRLHCVWRFLCSVECGKTTQENLVSTRHTGKYVFCLLFDCDRVNNCNQLNGLLSAGCQSVTPTNNNNNKKAKGIAASDRITNQKHCSNSRPFQSIKMDWIVIARNCQHIQTYAYVCHRTHIDYFTECSVLLWVPHVRERARI